MIKIIFAIGEVYFGLFILGGLKWVDNVEWAHTEDFAKKELISWTENGKNYG